MDPCTRGQGSVRDLALLMCLREWIKVRNAETALGVKVSNILGPLRYVLSLQIVSK